MSALTESARTVPFPDAGSHRGVADWFRAVAALIPDAEALTTIGRRYTYAEIDRWSDAIANEVLATGAPLDRPIAIRTRDNVAMVPAVMGALKAGHFIVAIDATDPHERIEFVLRDSEASICLVDSQDDEVASAGCSMLEIGDVPTRSVPPSPLRPPNPALLSTYTSGTTGTPKAAIMSQRRWSAKRVSPSELSVPARERIAYFALPGLARAPYQVFNALASGSTLCAFDARSESLSAFAEFTRRERPTVVQFPPALFRRLLRAVPDQLDFSAVRRLLLGGDVLTPADLDAFRTHFPREALLQCSYGSTESGEVCRIVFDHDTPSGGPILPMGPLLEGVEAWLMDENGHEVPTGATGEMVVRGLDVIAGYWNAPELTAEKFDRDPERPDLWTFRTGDLARRDQDGNYYYLGRKDGRLRIHSRRIDPIELENALVATGHVREAVVVAKPDDEGEPHLVAYVVVREGSPFEPRAIRSVLREQVPDWMVPSRIFELEEIPMTRVGKVDRNALATRVDPRREEEAEPAADDVERRLLAIWSRVVGMPVRLDDDFFDDLGGDSILGAHLVTAIQQEFGRAVPVSLIVELKTVRTMAKYVRTGATVQPLVVAIQEGTLPPLFIVTALFGSVMLFRALARVMGPEQTVYGLTNEGFDINAFPRTLDEIAASFVTAIRSIQPEGPYYLAGYSWGGLAAFEIARHFELAGEKVALVAAIDATAGKVTPVTFRRRVFRALAEPLKSIARWRRKRSRRPNIQREVRSAKMKLGWKTAIAGKEGSLGRYGGPVVLLRARDGVGRACMEEDLGWTRHVRGPLEIIDIEGDHAELMLKHVETTGRALARVLAKARCR